MNYNYTNNRRKLNMSGIISGYKIRYELLQRFISIAYAGSNATHVNLYIDLYSIIRSTYADNYDIQVDNYLDIVSEVINVALHYRHFFSKYLGVKTTIFLVAGDNTPQINSTLVMGYNSTMVYRKNSLMGQNMKQMLSENIELLKTIVPYIPDVHFIYTEFETAVCMKYIMNLQASQNNTSPNIVICKDSYPVQLATLDNNTGVLRPKKYHGNEMSYFINPLNSQENVRRFWMNFMTHRKIAQMDIPIDPCNLSMILALNGLQDRNIKYLVQFRKAISCVYNTVNKLHTFCSPDSLMRYNPELEVNISKTTIIDRYKALDINFQVENFYMNSLEAKMLEFKNKDDMNALQAINDRYFIDNPINLNFIV